MTILKGANYFSIQPIVFPVTNPQTGPIVLYCIVLYINLMLVICVCFVCVCMCVCARVICYVTL